MAAVEQRQAMVREGAKWDQRVQVVEMKDASGKAATVFKDVTVLGLVSRNVGSNGKPRTYTKEAAQAAIPLYEGARVFLDHTPPWELPSINRLAGQLEGVYWDEASQMLRARELRIERTDRTAHALHLCEAHPGLVGLSHDVTVACPADDDSQVVAIVAVRCVDLVPGGATTGGLYEQHGAPGVAVPVQGGTVTFTPHTVADRATATPAPGNAATLNTTMTEQETAALQAAQAEAAAAKTANAALQEQVNALKAQNTIAAAMEQAADLPEPTRKSLRATLEAMPGVTLERATEMVKVRRDELTTLGLIGKGKEPAAPAQTVTGAGAGAGTTTTAAQEQAQQAEAAAAIKQLRENAGRTAGLKGDALKAYTEQAR